ncbi:MAG: hypothetical protein AAB430_00675 [Patescibacteria group bacterium]
MSKAQFQSTVYLAVSNPRERGGENSLQDNEGFIDDSHPKISLNLHITGEENSDCLFTVELTDAGIKYSAGSAIDVRKVTGLSQEETMNVNIIKDGVQEPLTGMVQPQDLLIAMQNSTMQAEDGLVYVAVYGEE